MNAQFGLSIQELKQRELEAKKAAKIKKAETKAGSDLLDLEMDEPLQTEEQEPEPAKQSDLDNIFAQLNSAEPENFATDPNESAGGWQTEFKPEIGAANPEEEKDNLVADTFAKFGLNIDLLNPNAVEEELKVDSARNTGA